MKPVLLLFFFFPGVFYVLLQENSNDILEMEKQMTHSMTLISSLLNIGKID